MTETSISFVGVWTAIIAASVLFYQLLDGFDLGVGILHGFAPSDADRDLMMNSIAPVWDGNETWLVMVGAALLAAFPVAFAIIIPAVYFPILMMLLALVFRGVAFEFRFTDPARRSFWDRAFQYGSIIATFAQGMILGAFVQGFRVEGRQFAGGALDFLTPFSVFFGLLLLCGYGLLGAGWLIIKTEGPLQDWSRYIGRFCMIGVTLGLIVACLWFPMIDDSVAKRWLSMPNVLFLWPFPLIMMILIAWEWWALSRGDATPFIAAILLFFLSFIGIGVSLWPMVVPHHFTLWEAASSASTQAFLITGTLFILPVILMYTGWSYWVFRGKVRGDQAHYKGV